MAITKLKYKNMYTAHQYRMYLKFQFDRGVRYSCITQFHLFYRLSNKFNKYKVYGYWDIYLWY